MLAQLAAGSKDRHFARGLDWVAHTQRTDGGWAPHPAVDQSTWVTFPAVILLAEQPGTANVPKAVRWILAQSGRESGYAQRLREFLILGRPEYDRRYSGWPWFPGTAAWVAPTALAILALEKAGGLKPAAAIRARLESGRSFLLSRMCQDGGWNHGATRALGYEANSYAETTGLALLALHAVSADKLQRSLSCAERHLKQCRSAEGLSWLRLGLLVHGRSAEVPELPSETVLERSLGILAESGSVGAERFPQLNVCGAGIY